MNELPDFWRTEIWHPLSVHLPLSVLMLGSLFFLTGFFTRRPFYENMGSILLVIGTAGAWLAIYTGNLADGIVSRQICDPPVLKTHQTNAYVVGWLFAAASAVIVIDYLGFLKKIRRLFKLSVLVLSLTGSGFLIYTGHLGATLVYQQAAGVHIPSEDCSEFAD